MAANLTVQLATTSYNIGDLNSALAGGSTKPEEVIQQIINIILATKGGLHSGTYTVTSSTNVGTVSGQTGGTAAFVCNLT